MSKRGSPLLIGVLGLSCYTSAPAPPVPPAPPEPQAEMTIRPGSIGPITPGTRATLSALRKALPGYEVKPAHAMLGPNTNRLGFHVYKDGEKLLYVLPDGQGAIASVHALSPRVVAADRSWKMGARFNGARSISTCHCWEEEIVVCFRVGEHVAVSFARECTWDRYRSDDDRQDLLGAQIHRVLWSPRAFGEDSNPYGGGEYGGEEYGGY